MWSLPRSIVANQIQSMLFHKAGTLKNQDLLCRFLFTFTQYQTCYCQRSLFGLSALLHHLNPITDQFLCKQKGNMIQYRYVDLVSKGCVNGKTQVTLRRNTLKAYFCSSERLQCVLVTFNSCPKKRD